MILRSITKHVRDQNWFAVGIDFFIVIVGVFIGIQVANWNDAQRERVRAAEYAESLKLDLRAELEYSEGLIDYYRTTLSSGEIAYAGLTQTDSHSDEVILINAYRASQFNFYERRRSTFDEIVNAGMLNLIADPKLREVAILIYVTPPYSPPFRREGSPGAVAAAFCDRAHRRRTRLSGEDARPSKTPQTRGLAAPQ